MVRDEGFDTFMQTCSARATTPANAAASLCGESGSCDGLPVAVASACANPAAVIIA